jgi:hypothetical protein
LSLAVPRLRRPAPLATVTEPRRSATRTAPLRAAARLTVQVTLRLAALHAIVVRGDGAGAGAGAGCRQGRRRCGAPGVGRGLGPAGKVGHELRHAHQVDRALLAPRDEGSAADIRDPRHRAEGGLARVEGVAHKAPGRPGPARDEDLVATVALVIPDDVRSAADARDARLVGVLRGIAVEHAPDRAPRRPVQSATCTCSTEPASSLHAM